MHLISFQFDAYKSYYCDRVQTANQLNGFRYIVCVLRTMPFNVLDHLTQHHWPGVCVLASMYVCVSVLACISKSPIISVKLLLLFAVFILCWATAVKMLDA